MAKAGCVDGVLWREFLAIGLPARGRVDRLQQTDEVVQLSRCFIPLTDLSDPHARPPMPAYDAALGLWSLDQLEIRLGKGRRDWPLDYLVRPA
jgi:hypothetical protein